VNHLHGPQDHRTSTWWIGIYNALLEGRRCVAVFNDVTGLLQRAEEGCEVIGNACILITCGNPVREMHPVLHLAMLKEREKQLVYLLRFCCCQNSNR